MEQRFHRSAEERYHDVRQRDMIRGINYRLNGNGVAAALTMGNGELCVVYVS